MGNSFTRAVAYLPIAVVNALGEKLDDQIDITNCNIQEFNSKFAAMEAKLIYLIDKLFGDGDSSINTFNAHILFPYVTRMHDNIPVTENDINGETRYNNKKCFIIIEKIMKLYTTNQTKFDLTDQGNIIATNEDDSLNKDKTFWNLVTEIESNLEFISNTWQPIDEFLRNNELEDVSIETFQERINNLFNDEFLENYSFKQYFTILLRMIDIFIEEIDEHISFFKLRDEQNLVYHYTIGFFTWLGRSGYSYESTAQFYNYFKNNNINTLLRRKVEYKNNISESASIKIKNIELEYDSLYCSIKKNITDELRIHFHIENEDEPLEVAVSIGNQTISNYQNLCHLLTTKIIDKIREQNMNITFNMSHEHGHKDFTNLILIESNTKFTLKKQSTIQKIIGWNFFNDVKSQNKLDKNDNNKIIGQVLLSENILLNEQINEILERNLPLRLRNITTRIEDFVQQMNIQRSNGN